MAPKPSTGTGVRRAPLKRSSRGLSQFYAHKSQSFNCMQDLVNNPFSRSAIALAKRCSSGGQESSIASVEEEMSDCESAQQPRPLLCLRRTSSDWSAHSDGSSSPLQLSPANSTPEQLLEQQDALHDCFRQHQLDLEHDSSFHADSSQLLCSLGTDAPPTAADSLCVALQATSLAAPLASFSSFEFMPAGLVAGDSAY